MSNPDRIEILSEIVHDAWCGWMRSLLARCEQDWLAENGEIVTYIPNELVRRWQRQMDTRYEDLSEEEKESDREQARKILKKLGNGV